MNSRIAVLMLALVLGGCGPGDAPPTSKGFAGLGQQAEAFEPVRRGQPLVFPRDHGAHEGFRIEWWYVTANLKDAQGRDWGVQWTLFRSALRPGPEIGDWNSPNLWMGNVALTGPQGHRSAETLARGGIGQAGVEAQPFQAWINDWTLKGEGDIDDLRMTAAGQGFAYDLHLQASKPLILHGDRGYSEKSGQGQASYYYSQPFYTVQGQVELDGQRVEVTGKAWLDREWSSQPLAAGQSGWDWFSLHLGDGAKLMLFRVREAHGAPYQAGTWIDPTGQAFPVDGKQVRLEPLDWTRQGNGVSVPTRWRLRLPERGVDVQVQAIQPQAWMQTRFPYWEGPVRVVGGEGGEGYLEMTGYGTGGG
ncbi:lipocalin-like domain-containing protein [Pseudomonas alabamensis]|uniref:lipocalin-like domain-containing protein n=1 Tax=Pseudomonas alabamensis TaxID=3064349 RepID=UPI00350ECA27